MFEFLSSLDTINTTTVLFRIILSVVLGGTIGLERGGKRRAAGFRTYMLVCMGASLVMITNQFITENFAYSDPARLGAQVISGIGFLGAGTIIVTKQNQIIGLTTAAGLWASACIGLAVGIGFYSGAIAAGVFIVLIISGLHNLDSFIIANSRTMGVYVEFSKNGKLSDLLCTIKENSIKVHSVEFTRPKYEMQDQLAAMLSIRIPKRTKHYEVIESLSNIHGIRLIEEM